MLICRELLEILVVFPQKLQLSLNTLSLPKQHHQTDPTTQTKQDQKVLGLSGNRAHPTTRVPRPHTAEQALLWISYRVKGAFSRVKTGGTRSRARERSASRDEGRQGRQGPRIRSCPEGEARGVSEAGRLIAERQERAAAR